jgi:WD40 repeat protein
MELLFSSSYDDSIKCWKYDSAVEDWMCSYTISGHESTVWRISFYSKIIELDFDRTGEFLLSCGNDKTWMIWKISDTDFEAKGMASGCHSRAIYSCSWARASLTSSIEDPIFVDIIATVGFFSLKYCREGQTTK